ncbi:restriction endonuclease [Amphibacillus jilinensis]|uniref:restriction endonuclease n=1 Tax=Amphibacillus jilinensis TaxID=1216008 RepID=UPI0003099BEA|nr:restriction endonuclease [Amphibacillus jilinensis]
MNRTQAKGFIELLRISIMFAGVFFYFTQGLSFYFLIAVLIAPNILAQILIAILPKNKKTKRKTTSKKAIKKKPSATKNKVPTTRLLPDKQILKMPLEKMSGHEFERLCFLYYKAKGYKPKETGKGADGGVDLLIYQRQHKTYEAVQIKHYLNSGNQITVKEIRELNSAKLNHDCVIARFITTTTYTKDAMLQADKYKIETHGIEWVRSKVDTWRKEQAKKIS